MKTLKRLSFSIIVLIVLFMLAAWIPVVCKPRELCMGPTCCYTIHPNFMPFVAR